MVCSACGSDGPSPCIIACVMPNLIAQRPVSSDARDGEHTDAAAWKSVSSADSTSFHAEYDESAARVEKAMSRGAADLELETAFAPATASDNEAILIDHGKTDLCDGQPKRSATCFCNM